MQIADGEYCIIVGTFCTVQSIVSSFWDTGDHQKIVKRLANILNDHFDNRDQMYVRS